MAGWGRVSIAGAIHSINGERVNARSEAGECNLRIRGLRGGITVEAVEKARTGLGRLEPEVSAGSRHGAGGPGDERRVRRSHIRRERGELLDQAGTPDPEARLLASC